MSELAESTATLRAGRALTAVAARRAAQALAAEDEPSEAKKAFLFALHEGGETVEVVTAFAEVFRELALDPALGEVTERAIDIVGTGGSGSSGFNVSSATAIIVAACGQPVLKHGNRAITSQSGAADFLGLLGVTVQADPAVLRACVEELDFCFFFAPAFHPAFKSIMPVRLELAAEGRRTIFNILGPLINPARPRRQLLGVASPAWVAPLAEALTRLGVERGVAAHCALDDGRGMDELTVAGRNLVAGIGTYDALDGEWTAQQVGLVPHPAETIRGGTPAENVAAFRALLAGGGDPGLRETLVLNAGVALHLGGKVPTLEDGFAEARVALADGRVTDWLERARVFFEGL
ncbi:MAG: anthranilate phosphoribosyltransferase [Opitutales bacterium]